MPIKGVLLLLFIMASLPVCFLRPFYGIILWTITGFLSPQSSLLYWSVAQEIPWAEVVAIPTLAGLMLSHPRLRDVFRREGVLLLILWLWFTATTLNSVHSFAFASNAPDTWSHWSTVSKIFLMTAVTMALTGSWERLRWMLLAIGGAFGYVVAKSVPFMIITHGTYRLYGPPNSMVADNNDLGLALVMTVPVFFFLARTEMDRRSKWVMTFLLVASIPAIFLTYSRGALLGLVAVLICMFLQSKQKLALIPVAVLFLVIGIAYMPQQWKNRMDTLGPQTAELDASARSRLNAWTYSWRLANDYPIMGGGFDCFTPELFQRYAPDPLDVHGPHSVYFGVLAEHGFIGLALFLLLVASCLSGMRKVVRHCTAIGDVRGARYANMLRFSMIGFLVSGAFLGRAYFDYFYTIVACTSVLRRLVAEDERCQEEEPDESLLEEASRA